MKHSHILLVCLTLLSTTHHIQSSDNQNFDSKLNILQQSINMLIAQSNLAPEVAQDITNKINDLNKYTQANIQQDIQEIRVAAGLTSLLETAAKMSKAMDMLDYSKLINIFKYSARANAIHKLLIGAYPGRFKDQLHYTDPYTETIGFTLNDYFFNTIFTALVTIISPTSLGLALSLNTNSSKKDLSIRIAAGLTAHCAWLLQKKLISSFQQQNQTS